MMLTSTGSGAISPIGRTKSYYPAQKRGTLAQPVSGHNYDSVDFSAPAGRKSPDPMAIAGRMLFLVEE